MNNGEEKKDDKVFTLAERIDQVIDKMRAPIIVERRHDSGFGYPLSPRLFCIICGLRRFDPDPTGLTCGQIGCLSRLKEKIDEANVVKAERAEIEELVNEISDIVGIDHKKYGQDLTALLTAIRDIIEGIEGGVEQLEKMSQ